MAAFADSVFDLISRASSASLADLQLRNSSSNETLAGALAELLAENRISVSGTDELKPDAGVQENAGKLLSLLNNPSLSQDFVVSPTIRGFRFGGR